MIVGSVSQTGRVIAMAFRYPSFNRRGFVGLVGSGAAFLSCTCGRAHAQQPEQGGAIPGPKKSAKSTMLGAGADLLQSRSPISAINMYLNGFHFYADDMGRQIEAHHYCSHVTEEFFQCVIYDGNQADSRLIGVEYIVSERIFKSLPEEEKALWHSHRHEATSGELVMPGIPGPIEHPAIETLVSTYGKTWHTWQVDKDSRLPTGIPQLMMGFTADGQLKPDMIQKRDRELGINTADVRKAREDLASSASQPDAGTDPWKNGMSQQLTLNKRPLMNMMIHAMSGTLWTLPPSRFLASRRTEDGEESEEADRMRAKPGPCARRRRLAELLGSPRRPGQERSDRQAIEALAGRAQT